MTDPKAAGRNRRRDLVPRSEDSGATDRSDRVNSNPTPRAVPLGRVCDITLGKMLQSSPNGPRDIEVPYLRSGSLEFLDESRAWRKMYCHPSELRSYGLKTGDLLVAEGGEVGRAEFVPDLPPDAVFQNSLHRLRLQADGDLRFVRYALESARSSGWLDVLCNKTTFGHLTVEKLSQLRIPWPSPLEQNIVAERLDSETARIEALITAKLQLQQLLMHRRSRLPSRALEMMLASEQLIPLKHLVIESNRRSERDVSSTMLSVSIHAGVVPKNDQSDLTAAPEDRAKYKRCGPGDIVVNRMRAFQGGVGEVRQQGIVSPDYTVLNVKNQVSSSYLHFVMRSPWFISEMTRRLRGIGSIDQGQVRTPRINFSELGEIRVPIPSRSRQNDLVSELLEREADIAGALDLHEKQIALLSERRHTLVTSTVSGRL